MKVGSSETKGNWEVGTESACKLPFKEKEEFELWRGRVSTSVLHWGDSAPSREGHLTMSGDILGYHAWGARHYRSQVGRDPVHRADPTLHPPPAHMTENYTSPKCQQRQDGEALVCSDHTH